MNWLEIVENSYKKSSLPTFRAGDTLRVAVKIREGEGSKARERLQAYEGVCLRRHNAGLRSTFTVRKMSSGIGVERTFPLHSPMIDSIEVVRTGKVRRSRIYYIRQRVGKAARIRARSLFRVEDGE